MDENIIFIIVIAALFGGAFLIRFFAKNYADGKVALIMLSAEKTLSTWAKEQAINGSEKRLLAVNLIADKLLPMLPIWVKMFVNKEKLVDSIEDLYLEMLDFLDDGNLNDSI